MTDYFFVIAMGRSGTKWLADLLNCSESIRCMHEPLRDMNNERVCHLPFSDGAAALQYYKKRKARIDAARGAGRWGEVNSYLRFGVPYIREVFDDCPIAGLIRDGKQSVQSLMTRNIFKTNRQPPADVIQPPNHYQTRFDKICWYWAMTYRSMDSFSNLPIYRLEDLNEDYDTVVNISNHLRIEPPSKESWKSRARKPQNVGSNTFKWTQWWDGRFDQISKRTGNIQEKFYAKVSP